MTERGQPSMDGAPACPFVAYVDDRDGRSTSPDHRHRCFAESPPAPRALAHQEAYCLSSAFPVCPTFQDWARREAAQARADEAAGDAAAGAMAGAAATGDDARPAEPRMPPPARPPEEPPRRNPPRDWAAPPPWATSSTTAARSSGSSPPVDELLAGRSIEGQGLAGSAADQLAGGTPPSRSGGGGWSASTAGTASTPPDTDLAGLVGERLPTAPPTTPRGGQPPAPDPGRRPTVSSSRPSGTTVTGPPWERAQRYEAYPSIRTRASLPGIPRLGVLVGALAIAALAVFMLPALLGIGGPGASPRPSATAAPSVSVEPTALPAPTPQVYVIKTGDTLSKVAKKFGVTLDDLLAANKATIKDPDKIAVGDEVIIPLPPSDGEPSPAASGSSAP
jgi:LysM repeat protein